MNNQIVANIGIVTISTGSSSLTGGGSLLLVASNALNASGTVVQSLTIKSTGNTSLGMIRFFVSNLTTDFLFREVMVAANDQTGVVPAFSATINEPFMLQPGYELKVSTQNSETFNIVAKGQDVISCLC